jgi:hypothetical protein
VTKERLAQVITVLLLGGVVAFVLWKQRGAAPVVVPPAKPEDAVYAMLDAAQAGDVDRYQDQHAGAAAEVIRRAVAETGPERFAQSLRELHRPLKGVAVMEPEPVSESEVRVNVEFVFQDRNETQLLRLRKEGARWRIVDSQAAERTRTVVPYGTPVN